MSDPYYVPTPVLSDALVPQSVDLGNLTAPLTPTFGPTPSGSAAQVVLADNALSSPSAFFTSLTASPVQTLATVPLWAWVAIVGGLLFLIASLKD